MSRSPVSDSTSTRQRDGDACHTCILVTPSSSEVTSLSPGSDGNPKVALLSAYPAKDSRAEARIRLRSWPAVTAGALTGRALAATGNAHRIARPPATSAHRHPSLRRSTLTADR